MSEVRAFRATFPDSASWWTSKPSDDIKLVLQISADDSIGLHDPLKQMKVLKKNLLVTIQVEEGGE